MRTSTVRLSPVPPRTQDLWTVMSDGSVAIVRGDDYHVDWVDADGTRSSSPKVAHAWRPINDQERTRLMDSIQQVVAAMTANEQRMQARTPTPLQRAYEAVSPAEVPDRYPPFPSDASAIGDVNGNLWIATQQARPGAAVPGTPGRAAVAATYDILNRKGELVDRVQLPDGYVLAGFGQAGTVYVAPIGARGVLGQVTLH